MNMTRAINVTVVISVVLNLLLVGFILGQRLPPWGKPFGFGQPHMMPPMKMEPSKPMFGGPDDINLFAAMRTLGPEQRTSVEDIFRQHLPKIRADVEDMAAKRRDVLTVLANDQADMEHIAAALAALRQARATAQENAQAVFLEIARDLPAEKRAAFLKAAVEPGPRSGPGPGPGPRPPPHD